MPGRKNKIRVVIDTNLWVSFAIGKQMNALHDVVLHPLVEVYASKELLDELKETLKKPKLKKIISSSRSKQALKLIRQSVFVVNPKSSVRAARDPMDDFLLSLCRACEADFLISGDKDLLSLRSFEETEIVSFQNFIKELNR